MSNQEKTSSIYFDSGPEGLSWSQERRLKFIDYRLRWEGRINRQDLKDFFEISMPQATADLARYFDAAPDNMEYDRSTKAYLRLPSYSPVYERSSTKMYLVDLLALSSGIVEKESSLVKWRPPVAILPTIGRQVDGEMLMLLLRGIREGRMVNVEYQSVQRPTAAQRILSPHGLAYDGFRWHVRAFCHTRKRFLDFVVARIVAATLGASTSVAAGEDQEWHTELTLKIGPQPGLSEASRRALALDYGMIDGVVEVKCRHAMLFYTLLKFGLLYELPRPEAQHLVLLNREELQPFLEMLWSSSSSPQSQPLL